jgi:hypothetical protein
MRQYEKRKARASDGVEEFVHDALAVSLVEGAKGGPAKFIEATSETLNPIL